MIGLERKTEIVQMESMYLILYEWCCKVFYGIKDMSLFLLRVRNLFLFFFTPFYLSTIHFELKEHMHLEFLHFALQILAFFIRLPLL